MIAIHTPSKSDPPDVWKPTFHCCWCGSEFVQIDLFKRRPAILGVDWKAKQAHDREPGSDD